MVRISLGTALLVLLIARAAAADIAPSPGSRSCSIEARQAAGEKCVACSAHFSDAVACAQEYAHRGFSFRCRSKGDEAWVEVWCKTATDVAPSSLNEPPDAEPLVAPVAADPDSSAPSVPPPASAPAEAPATTFERAPASPASSPPATPPQTTPEKAGSCGACQAGAPRSLGGAGAGLLLVALFLSRRVQRSRRSRSITCVGSASSMLERRRRIISKAPSSPLPAARSK